MRTRLLIGFWMALGCCVAIWLGLHLASGPGVGVATARGPAGAIHSLPARAWKAPALRGTVVADQHKLDGFLKENEGAVEAWLAVGMITNDLNLLRKAARRFPADPRVHLRLGLSSESPEERRVALEQLLKIRPDHQLGRHLLALAQWESGAAETAQETLESVTGGSALEDDGGALIPVLKEAYLAAGESEQAAMANAIGASEPTFLQTLDTLDESLRHLENDHSLARDADAADAVRAMRSCLAARLQRDDGPLLSQLTGLQMELSAEEALSAERVGLLREREAELKRLMRQADPTEAGLPPATQAEYVRRWKAEGEVSAMRWLAKVHPRQVE